MTIFDLMVNWTNFQTMTEFLNIAIYITIAIVTVILAAGIYALFRGGNFGRTWSNRLMRLRVLFQFIAVLLIVALYWMRDAFAGT